MSDTLVACLTPPGQAALATLALRGPRGWELARGAFRLPSGAELPEVPVPGRSWFGKLGDALADDVVLAVKSVEPYWLEAHCHGGRAVVRLLLDLFEARGAILVGWQEFLRRTEGDPLRAAAAIALAHAPTARTAAILLDQHGGALRGALDAILAALGRGEGERAAALLAELTGRCALGRHLTGPWRVVVAGAPNVGKSSLVNALAGYQRSIVAPTPGTTRDVVTTRLALDGWPVELADTAGLRAGAEELEEEGIRRARASAASADRTLWVVDASSEPTWPGPEMSGARVVVNKIDLAPAWELERAGDVLRVSAVTGAGVPELCEALSRWLVPEAPPGGSGVPFTDELCAAVEEALAQVGAGRLDEARRALAAL